MIRHCRELALAALLGWEKTWYQITALPSPLTLLTRFLLQSPVLVLLRGRLRKIPYLPSPRSALEVMRGCVWVSGEEGSRG